MLRESMKLDQQVKAYNVAFGKAQGEAQNAAIVIQNAGYTWKPARSPRKQRVVATVPAGAAIVKKGDKFDLSTPDSLAAIFNKALGGAPQDVVTAVSDALADTNRVVSKAAASGDGAGVWSPADEPGVFHAVDGWRTGAFHRSTGVASRAVAILGPASAPCRALSKGRRNSSAHTKAEAGLPGRPSTRRPSASRRGDTGRSSPGFHRRGGPRSPRTGATPRGIESPLSPGRPGPRRRRGARQRPAVLNCR
jgi:hypothetical protein